MSHDWTTEQKDELKRLRVEEKKSANQICKALNEKFAISISRSSVISQFRRLNGIPSKPKKETKPQMPLSVRLSAIPESSVPTLLTVKDGWCRWPMWGEEEGQRTFPVCGQRTRVMSPYCDEHNRKSGR